MLNSKKNFSSNIQSKSLKAYSSYPGEINYPEDAFLKDCLNSDTPSDTRKEELDEMIYSSDYEEVEKISFNPDAYSLYTKLQNFQARIMVLGQGYVGLPLGVGFASKGFKVTGIDISSKKIEALNSGNPGTPDVTSEELFELLEKDKIDFSTDLSLLQAADVILICVPSPLTENGVPDLSYIRSAAETIGRHIKPGTLVVLESSTYPGCTRDIIVPELSAKYRVGEEVFVCYSPERIDPGNKQFMVQDIPKVCGGFSKVDSELGQALYSHVTKVVLVDSPEEAETVKLFENTFRLVNIGMINEMAQLCDRMDMSVWNIVRAAATKPFGFMPFFPSLGVGGHCIPLDPKYLTYAAVKHNIFPRFIDSALDINHSMPRFVAQKIQQVLGENDVVLKGANVLLLGVAYKKNIDDMRESPALDLWDLLLKQKANVSYYDPFVEKCRMGDKVHDSIQKKDFQFALSEADIVVIATPHDDFDIEFIIDNSKLVYDCGGVTLSYGKFPSVHVL